MILVNGCAGNPVIDRAEEKTTKNFMRPCITSVSGWRRLSQRTEKGLPMIEVDLKGAQTEETARLCARSVASSSLVKAAVHGSDANWGRVLCAMDIPGRTFDQGRWM